MLRVIGFTRKEQRRSQVGSHQMSLLTAILSRVAFPLSALFSLGYAIDDIRDAVINHIPAAANPPLSVLIFFCSGASIGILSSLLIVPDAVLNKRYNQEELKSLLGVSGSWAERTYAFLALCFICTGLYGIVHEAYGQCGNSEIMRHGAAYFCIAICRVRLCVQLCCGLWKINAGCVNLPSPSGRGVGGEGRTVASRRSIETEDQTTNA
jgi:hypothetical protein